MRYRREGTVTNSTAQYSSHLVVSDDDLGLEAIDSLPGIV